jgi:DeoR/GlpR family transcriptional regulator of sugar metabolism
MASNAVVFKRRRHIVEIVDTMGTSTVDELARKLDVSAITIRRDLDHLHAEGSIMRRHGGAMSAATNVDGIPEKNLIEKDVLNMDEKLKIAIRAARLVEDDDILFMNSGSTTLCFFKALAGRHIKVITNNAAAIAADHGSGVELMMLGGEYREQSQSLVGEFALNAISNIYADHTILGANGISLEKGLTTSVYQECSVNQAMIEHTHGKVIVLADSSKMGKVANFVSSSLARVDIVVTDRQCPTEFREGLAAMGIEVILA